jgi:hypothetical protein
VPAVLPDAVERQLATASGVLLAVRTADGEVAGPVAVAPLQGRFSVLVTSRAPLVAALARSTAVELRADDPEGGWSVRVRGRGVAGRRVTSDARRAEVLHWLPDGASARAFLTVLVHPEEIVYVTGRGDARTRAAGPALGVEVRSPLARWERVLGVRAGVCLAAAAVVGTAVAFLYAAPGLPRALTLLGAFLTGGLLACGCVLAFRLARFTRWREGLTDEADAALVAEGWIAPRSLAVAAWVAAVAGVCGTALVYRYVAPLAAGMVVLGSGAWWFGPSEMMRHLLRRADAAEDKG